MSKQPTIHDVARQCGYSKSTVSLVLQDSSEIPAPTKEEVMKAMKLLGYRHNRFARSLRTRKSQVVGMMIQDHLNPFYSEIIQYVEQHLREKGYDLIVSSSNSDIEAEIPVIERLFEMQVDGMIVSTMNYDRIKKLLKSIQDRGTHCVVAGAVDPEIPFDTATISHQEAMRAAMEHLFQLGHKNIGFIWGAPAFQSIGARFEVFRQELEAAGLTVRNEWVKHCGFRLSDGYEAAKALLSERNHPTAVMALNDLLAFASIRAARDLGLTVPGDISVVGVDNIEFSAFMCPSLTTISQPIARYAQSLTDLVLGGIEKAKQDEVRRVELSAEFMIRESTGRACKA